MSESYSSEVSLKIKKTWPSLYIPKSNRITEWIVYTLKDTEDNWYVSSKSRIYPDGKWKIEDPKMVEEKNVGRKNERLGKAQAEFEAQAKLDVKVRKNHATHILAEAQEFFDNEAEGTVDKYQLRPMLGKDIMQTKKKNGKSEEVFEIHRLHFPVIVQKKLNGIHVMVFYDEKIDQVILMSRTGLIFEVFENIAACLLPWFRKNKSIIIDGELYSHNEKTFQALSGISRKKKLEDLDEKQKTFLPKIIVNVFDFIDLQNMQYGYSQRMANAEELLGAFLEKLQKRNSYIPCEIIETYPATDRAEIDKIYEAFLNDGYEGAMIRNDNLPFIFGKRVSDRLFKYKPEYDDEFKLIGFEEASGKLAKTPIWIFETKDKMQFKCTPTGDIPSRQAIFAEVSTEKGAKKWIGKYYTIKYYGLSNDGIPTHANVDTPPVNKHKGGI